ncbi:MAG: hypothetical protein ACK5NB_00005, partial [Flavobacteriaceae bacterium]
TNATNIATNATDITALETEQTTQNANIAANTTAINSHVTADKDTDDTNEIQTIASADNSVTVTPNANGKDFDLKVTPFDASGLQSQIDANETAIATNATNIATNATDITALETEQTTQNTNIAANTTAIDNHVTADKDTDDSNELQTLSISGNEISLTDGGSVTLPTIDGSETSVTAGANISVTGDGTSAAPYIISNTFTEVDGSETNELQTLSISGNEISLTDGGSVTVNTDDADAIIGNEVTGNADATLALTGDGTTASPLKLGVAADGITATQIADNAVNTSEIANDAVTLAKLANGTTNGQIMQWNSTSSEWELKVPEDYKHIAISEFVRGEPVLQDKGRIMFTVPSDMAGYKTDKMTCSIRELGTGNVTVTALLWRTGTESTINETVTINSSVVYTATSLGGSAVTLAEGDLVYLNITAAPAYSSSPKGLSCTIKLLP